MAKVDLKAVKSFVYRTRRLMPEEHFQARNEAEASILVELAKKARYTRIPGEVPAPPAETAAKIEDATKPRRRARRTTKK